MRRLKNVRLYWVFVCVFFLYGGTSLAQTGEFIDQIKQFPEVISVKKIDNNPFFKETYEVMVDQYLDHKNLQAGKFKQRVIVSNYNPFSPIVYVTEGYHADYAANPKYINELSKIVEANQIVVEHRYFGKSIPENLDWQYLTVENACADLHRILKMFKRVYTHNNKWISTGISKGGQTTLAYKTYYPDDANIWLPYVAPLNFGVEESLHDKYLEQIGTEMWRKKIKDFQLTILKNRIQILPMLDSLSKVRGYSYPVSTNELLDFLVLEYPFAFWQWGELYEEIPDDTMNIKTYFGHLVNISNPDYFSFQGIAPLQAFFVQAARELGYYGYNIKPLQPYLSIQSSKGYLKKIFLSNFEPIKFNSKTSKLIQKTINADGDHIIMIYGEYDPWTASSVQVKASSKAVKMVIPKACHKVRLENMSYAERATIYMLLETWMEED